MKRIDQISCEIRRPRKCFGLPIMQVSWAAFLKISYSEQIVQYYIQEELKRRGGQRSQEQDEQIVVEGNWELRDWIARNPSSLQIIRLSKQAIDED
jgi:hypothetical protein